MTLKRRLDSNWRNIKIIDNDGGIMEVFELDRYGRLSTKFEKKTPRNIKLLMTTTLQKQTPTTPKPFILPKILPPPLPTPIICSNNAATTTTNGQNNLLKMPQINFAPPQPMNCDNLSEVSEGESAEAESDSPIDYFIDDGEFIFENDPFNGLDIFEMPTNNVDFLF